MCRMSRDRELVHTLTTTVFYSFIPVVGVWDNL